MICDRISRLRESKNLEEAPSAMLKYLGELKRPYLKEVEEKLLGLIEREYGVNEGNEPIADCPLMGSFGFGLIVSFSKKSSMPVAPVNIPSPPVIIKEPEPDPLRFTKSIKAVAVAVPDTLLAPLPLNSIKPSGKPSKPIAVGSVLKVNKPVDKSVRA